MVTKLHKNMKKKSTGIEWKYQQFLVETACRCNKNHVNSPYKDIIFKNYMKTHVHKVL